MTIRTAAMTLLTAITLAAGSNMALADSAPSNNAGPSAATHQAQGMYSANRLIGAPVYGKGDDQNAIGSVDDVLLGNRMQIRKFVIQTKGRFGVLGGKSYVVSPDQLAVQTQTTHKATQPDYRVELNITRNQLGNEPVYSDAWWTQAQKQADQAWQDTKSATTSAWTKVKNATSNIVNGGKSKGRDAAKATGHALQKAGNKMSNALDSSDNASGDNATGNN